MARCALSALLPRIDGKTRGDNVWVSRAVKAADRERPSKPRYTTFWDVSLVFTTFERWGANSGLSLLRLGKKLALQILLYSGQRGQALGAMSVDDFYQSDDGSVTFNLTEPMKTHKNGQLLDQIVLKPYHRRPNLCVVRTLKEYLQRTRDIRSEPQLLVTSNGAHTGIKRGTVTTWVTEVLRLSGVNTDRGGQKFGPHSTRGASVSKGAQLGVQMDILMKFGSWKSERTMAKHYQRPIVEKPEEVDLGSILLDDYAEGQDG